MKYYPISVVILICLFPLLMKADILLQEDFTNLNLPTDWTNTIQQGSANWLIQSTPTFGSLSGGGYVVFDDFALGSAITPNEATLTTPSVNCVGREAMRLRYYHYWLGIEFTHGFVEISNDGGSVWTTIVDYETITKGSLLVPQDTSIDISTFADNQPDVRVRFRYTDGSQAGRYWYLDDIAIYSGLDVGVTAMVEPESLLCGGTFDASDTVKVEIYNYSIDTIWNIPIDCEITGDININLSEVYQGFIPPLSSVVHTFDTALDFSGNNKIFIFNIFTSLGTESYTTNDTIHATRQGPITGYPYHEDLMVSNYDWKPDGSPSFEFGSFTKMGGNAGFGNSWVTTLNGNYANNLNAYIVSPFFDFTETPTEPILTYDYKYETEPCCDFVRLQYSLNGTTWINLSDEWRGDGFTSWNKDTIVLNFDNCNISCVQFRFYIRSDGSATRGGFTFDNFKISPNVEINDAVAEDIIFNTDCSYTSMMPIGLSIKNNNEHHLCEEIIITTMASHPILPTQMFEDTITVNLKGCEIQDFYYPNLADFSGYNTGDYTLSSTVFFSDDIDPSNNSITRTVPFVIDAYPYDEDFDAGKGGWRRVGDRDFELGAFTKMDGNTGFGNSWVTKLKGNYSDSQNSYVESPVFDLTNMVCPAVIFDHKYFTESCCDRAYLDYSLNGGGTWLNLLGSWQDEGFVEWNYAETNIANLVGNSCVQFRFRFRTDGSGTRDGGFSFDNFNLLENEKNVSVTNIFEPLMTDEFCNRRLNQPVTAEIYNGGCSPVFNIPIAVNMTGANTASYNEIIPDTILSGETFSYTFTNTLNMSDTGTYFIVVNTNFPGDPYSRNDSFDIEIYEEFVIPVIDAYPANESFDTGDGDWFAVTDTEFELGSFTKMGGNTGFGDSWVTKLSGDYSNNGKNYIYSPIYDLYNTPPEPVLEFDYKYYTESCCDYADLQYSLDGGVTWARLAGDWRGDGYTSWNHETIVLNFNTCDITCVMFRFYFQSDGSATRDGGFAFDNFKITPNNLVNDAAVDDFLIDKNCTYGTSETFGLNIVNTNDYRICEEIVLTSVITHPTLPTQTLIDTFTAAIPPNFFQNFYYSTPIDLSGYTLNNYTVTSSIYFPEDIDSSNDTLVGTIPFVVTNFPYYEDFDSGKKGWSQAGIDQFVLGSFTKMDGNAGYGNSWVTKLSGDYDNNLETYVESPIFDLTNIVCPAILFEYKHYTESCCDFAQLQYSINGGTNWLYLTGDWRGDAYTSWNNLEYNIQSLAGNSCVQFRFRFRSDGSAVRDGGFAFDNFQLLENENNVSVVNILNPKAEFDFCERRTNEIVQVEVYNGGCNTLINIPIEVNMTGALSQNISEIITDPIASGATYTYTFTNTLNMSDTGLYNIQVNTNFGLDPDPGNDTSYTSVYEEFAVPIVNSFPYTEDFDTSIGNWFHTGTPYFEWGTFNKMGGNAGYGNSWVTKLVGNYDNNTSAYLNSPIFDLTNLQCPAITFDFKYYTESCCDKAFLQYSTNGGNSWTTLKTYAGDNYPDWDFDDVNLSALAGNPCVMFRFYWVTDGSAVRDGGLTFDNVFVGESDFNLSVVRMIEPVANPTLCDLRNPQEVTIELFNNGCTEAVNVPVELTMSGAGMNYLSETIPGPILAGQSYTYTFANTLDMSDTGWYNFMISSNLTNDPIRIDDTLITSVYEEFERMLFDTFPYVENFDNGSAGWTASGSPSFELGTFTKLNGNAGYGDSWVTNINGNYPNNANPYVVSPIFDLSNTTCPVVSFIHKYNTESCCDYVWFQYSLDGGISWVNLVGNWRGQGDTDWNYINQNINALAGQSCVTFRFWLRSDISVNSGGFTFDNFMINDISAEASLDNIVACWGSSYDIEVTVKNNIHLYCSEQDSIGTITLEYLIDGVPGSQTYTGLNIQPNTIEVLSLNNVLIPSATSSVKIWQKLPNGIYDPILENDTLVLNTAMIPNCNDHCRNAQFLTIGTTTTSQTSNATIDSAEDPTFSNCGGITIENTVWYTFMTDAQGGMVTVGFEDILCSPSANGIQVSIDALNGPSCVSSSLNNLYCNSPTDTVPFEYGPVLLPPNTTYYIVIDGFAGNNCDFDIVLSGAIFNPNPSGQVVVNNNLACNSDNSGTATVLASDGTLPYTYAWDNGETTPTATALSAGTHTVTVTEASGNTFTASVQLTEPTAITTTVTANTTVSCNGGNDGSASISANGGTPGYSYSWDNGSTTATATGLTAGTHAVTLTDANGCTVVESILITSPTAIEVSTALVSNVSCNGLSDGAASISGTGGTPSYSILWDNGETTATATNLSAGAHMVTLTDANGCSVVESVMITAPSAITASTSVVNMVSCNGLNDGSASITANGGTPSYTILWDNGETTATAISLTAGMHSVTLTDANGCAITESIMITAPPGMTADTIVATEVSCSSSNDGTATITVSGGTASYTYTWDSGATTATATGLSISMYSVTATDVNGCFVVATVQVPASSVPDLVVFTQTNEVSCGGMTDGAAIVSASFGHMPYTYLWDANAGNQTTATATGLEVGVYMVTVTDNNGCSSVDGVLITEAPCDYCQIADDNNTDICVVLTADPNDPLASLDCDGDGVRNFVECNDTTDPTNPCDFVEANITEPITADQSGCLNLCPDLTVTTTLIPGNISGPSAISIRIDVTELNLVDAGPGPITVRMPSDQRLTFNWNITANPSWNYLGNTGIFHTFTYNGNNGILFGGSTESILISLAEGVYDPQGTEGRTTITASVIPFSGGECTLFNNADAETLVYFQ